MENVKYEIPQWALDIAIEGLQDLARRRLADAAAYSKIGTQKGRDMAQELLKQADEAQKGYEFYLHL